MSKLVLYGQIDRCHILIGKSCYTGVNLQPLIKILGQECKESSTLATKTFNSLNFHNSLCQGLVITVSTRG